MVRTRKELTTVFARRLLALREKKRIDQHVVAAAINVTSSAISRYETGKSEPPFNTLIHLAQYYDVDPNYLLGWTSDVSGGISENEFLYLLESHGRQIYKEIRTKL